jgi:hypothetical protein
MFMLLLLYVIVQYQYFCRPLAELEYPPFELAADANVNLHRWFDGKVWRVREYVSVCSSSIFVR